MENSRFKILASKEFLLMTRYRNLRLWLQLYDNNNNAWPRYDLDMTLKHLTNNTGSPSMVWPIEALFLLLLQKL